jgi:hypothetical protein
MGHDLVRANVQPKCNFQCFSSVWCAEVAYGLENSIHFTFGALLYTVLKLGHSVSRSGILAKF